jgi:hypothetical protein
MNETGNRKRLLVANPTTRRQIICTGVRHLPEYETKDKLTETTIPPDIDGTPPNPIWHNSIGLHNKAPYKRRKRYDPYNNRP